MAKRDHYTGTDIRNSRLTKHRATVGGFSLYSHSMRNVFGNYVVVLNADEWVAFESLADVDRAYGTALVDAAYPGTVNGVLTGMN